MSEPPGEPVPARSRRRLAAARRAVCGVLGGRRCSPCVLLDPTLFGRTVLDRGAVQRDVAAQFQQREGVAVTLVCPQEMAVVTGRQLPVHRDDGERRDVPVRIVVTTTSPAAYTWTLRLTGPLSPAASPGRTQAPDRGLQPVGRRQGGQRVGIRRAAGQRPLDGRQVDGAGDGDHDGCGVEIARGGVHLLQHGGGQRRLGDDGPRDGGPDAGEVAELVDQGRRRLGADPRDARAARRSGSPRSTAKSA